MAFDPDSADLDEALQEPPPRAAGERIEESAVDWAALGVSAFGAAMSAAGLRHARASADAARRMDARDAERFGLEYGAPAAADLAMPEYHPGPSDDDHPGPSISDIEWDWPSE